MSMRRPRDRALRPRTEDLEGRRLLSATFRGTNIDGTTYTLRLAGPGDLRVNEVDTQGNPVTDPTTPALINSITIAGADPTRTRLIGRVNNVAPGSDGRVFFQSLTELGGRAEGATGGLGILAIDMPNFWLGATTATLPTGETRSITIPDGVITLRFGGVDTTFTFPGGTPLNTNNQSDQFTVNLGLPRTQGTSIIVDRVVTSAQPGTATSTTPATPTEDSVTFTVVGRINVFQANSIEGNTTVTPLPNGFATSPTSFSSATTGGTVVVAQTDPNTGAIGQIGFVNVGGNATNFSAQAAALISNYYIGGETNNVFLLAPAGSRNVFFGKGMDTATIRTHFIGTLKANRGALNSTVTVDRTVDHVLIGGDVVNTQFNTGLGQGLASIFSNQAVPTTPPQAQDGGAIGTVTIAGNVIDSAFSASVEPSPDGVFGTPQDLVLPHGHIRAKVEGTISNSTAVSDQADAAFFAHSVQVSGGPVVPPNVPEEPFPNAGAPPHGHRIVKGLQPTTPPAGSAATGQVAAQSAARAAVPRPSRVAPAANKAKAPRA
jgi:hypothetical protein